jgi:antitoxin VapB
MVHPMSLNIKSEEAHRLARELARLTGESMTAAVTEAVRQRL